MSLAERITRDAAFFAALAIFAAVFVPLYNASLAKNDGRFIYALDDAYIHMAIAKNLASHGVWGVAAHEFSSAASSLAWPMLLALTYLVAGVNEWAPLALNLAFVALTLFITDRTVRHGTPTWLGTLLSLVATWLFVRVVPLPLTVFTGLEHTFHIATVIGAMFYGARYLEADNPHERKRLAPLALLFAPLVTLARYETLALTAFIAFAALLRRRFRFSLLYALLACAPIVLFGLYAISEGSMFLPNSVALKGGGRGAGLVARLTRGWQDGTNALDRVAYLAPIIWATALAALASLAMRRKLFAVEPLFALFSLAMIWVHAMFARFGWLYRYEAYLIAMMCVSVLLAISLTARSLIAPQPASPTLTGAELVARANAIASSAIAALFVATPLLIIACITPTRSLVDRQSAIDARVVQATNNIYEQQIQTARFIAKWYNDDVVGLNDIGAPSFFSDIRLLDLWGLGSIEVARLRLAKNYNVKQIEKIARKQKMRVAFVYDKWFQRFGGVPKSWVRAGEWKIRDNVICGSSRVAIYGINEDEAAQLRDHLAEFATMIPKRVTQTIDKPRKAAKTKPDDNAAPAPQHGGTTTTTDTKTTRGAK